MSLSESAAAVLVIHLAIIPRMEAHAGAEIEETAARVLEGVVRAGQFAEGVEYVPLSALMDAHVDEQVRDCGASIACICERLGSAGVDKAVLVGLDATSKPPLVTLEIADTARRSVVGSTLLSLDGRSDPHTLAQTEAAKLLEASGLRIGGHLIVETSPPDAKVVRDPPFGAELRSNLFLLPPGPYLIKGSRPGYQESSARVELVRLEEKRIDLVLAPEPSVVSSPWFWVGVGGAATAVAATAAVIFFHSKAQPIILCQGMCQ